jgi:hypothetical protein
MMVIPEPFHCPFENLHVPTTSFHPDFCHGRDFDWQEEAKKTDLVRFLHNNVRGSYEWKKLLII